MNKTILHKLILISLIILGLSACNSSKKDEPAKTDNHLKTHRIVSLSGAITETLYALGLGNHVVGTDVTSTYPEAAEKLPKVGHNRNISIEGIISLSPTLVIAKQEELNPDIIDKLKSAGIEIMSLDVENSPKGTEKLILDIAEPFGLKNSTYSNLIGSIQSDMNKVTQLTNKPSVLFIYARGAGNLMVAGNQTPIQSMIELAGGKNAISGFTSFKPLTTEALVTANPDVLLMFSSGKESLEGDGGIWEINGMKHTTAFKNKAIISMDGLYLSGFTPRVGKAVLDLNLQLSSLMKESASFE